MSTRGDSTLSTRNLTAWMRGGKVAFSDGRGGKAKRLPDIVFDDIRTSFQDSSRGLMRRQAYAATGAGAA